MSDIVALLIVSDRVGDSDKLIARIIFLDGSPNMQTLESLHIGKTVKAVVDSDLQTELSARSLYAEAATHCH
jgi:bacterioferritin